MRVSCCCDGCRIFMHAIILFIDSMLSSTLAFHFFDFDCVLTAVVIAFDSCPFLYWLSFFCLCVDFFYQCLDIYFIRSCFFCCCIRHHVDNVRFSPDVGYCCCCVPEKVFYFSIRASIATCLCWHCGTCSTLVLFLPPLPPLPPLVAPAVPLLIGCCLHRYFRVSMPISQR